MSELPAQRPITTELVMGVEVQDDQYKLIEVVDGDWLVQPAIGAYFAVVTPMVLWKLMQHTQEHDLGYVYGPGLAYVLAGDRNNIRTLRKASVSFVAKSRAFHSDDYYYQPPDVAVETVAPQKTDAYRERKFADWLQAGTQQVWAVDRGAAQARVHLPGGTVQVYEATDTLSGGDVLPGFAVQVSELFDV